ncbi:MAG: hypothetical protein OXM55_05695, partial [Bdellovibrionales bacterium]|nr:hypothetical protein [Bdellovibrionales bacterium]
ETTKEEISLEIKKKEQVSDRKREDLVIEQGKKRTSLTEELLKTEEELSKAQADLASTKKEMENIKKELKILGEKLHALK